ncbi:MAG: hypothetical protein E6767_13960 [Dysgonomonas sp.]|nr:hypothetical protein [Dysgonomonas sp.]
MNATILTSVFAVLVSITNLSAQNVKVYSNTENSEAGVKKELVTLDNKTSAPLGQNIYVYNTDGNIQEKVVNKWVESKGWVSIGKYEYQYNEVGNVANLTYTKWDDKKNNWADESQFLVHVYNDNNELISINELKVSSVQNLFTQK